MKLSQNRVSGMGILGMVFLLGMAGCASLAEGVTKAMMDSGEEEKDTRQCRVEGPKFRGMEEFMEEQEKKQNPTASELTKGVLKVLMVHGIGPHEPGHSTRLSENLARALHMSVREQRYKEFNLTQSQLFPDENLGSLRITRYFNESETREMIFYELTWAPILAKYKKLLAFDDSGEHSFRRAEVNKILKTFSNSFISDPVIYLGEPQERVKVSVSQALCWMLSSDWAGLPNSGDRECISTLPGYLSYLKDEYVFMSHSLGSRVLLDSLQRITELAARFADPNIPAEELGFGKMEESERQLELEKFQWLKEKEFSVYMLSNQLLLMQLGRPKPTVTEQFARYCQANAPEAQHRFMKGLRIVAFSDPNDLLSYAVPPNFVDEYMDSRMCPTMVNVSINVAKVQDLLGFGRVANPLTAHAEYDNDQRVLSLVTRGIGTEIMDPIIKDRCEWIETR